MPRSTNRAFEILEAIGASNKGLKHGEIAQALNIPKSTLTKIIKDLLVKEYLEIDETSNTYTIGSQMLILARSYLNNLDIVKIAQPVIYEAMTKTGESASLFIKKRHQAIVIVKENSSHILCAILNVGENVPLYAAAGGKAILAFLPDEEIDLYLATVKLDPLTANTITDPRRLRKELMEIRKTGLACSYEEQFEGLIAIATPVFGLHESVMASVCMPFPKSRFNDEKRKIIESTLWESSTKISRKFGVVINR